MWSGLVSLQANPISLVTVKHSSKLPRQPRNLTVHEFQKFPRSRLTGTNPASLLEARFWVAFGLREAGS